MKRADLVAGEAYWYSRGNDWLESLSAGQKLVVVDTGCWELPSYSSWNRSREPRKATRGNGVLVDLTHQGYGPNDKETVRRTVVNLTQIRGPYEETRKQVEEFTEKRRTRLAAQQEARDETARKIQAAIARATELGVKAHRAGWQVDEISVPTADFVRLLDMIKE